jgi:F-type H+-transporting ATPase subunit delta
MGFAKEQNALEAVAADMELIASTCHASEDLESMLKSPIIKTEKKVSVLNQIFSGNIGTVSQNFLKVIAAKNREAQIADIATAFVQLYKESKGIVIAEITSAIPLDEATRSKAVSLISSMGSEVELTEKIDKNIIGGFIIRVGDKQYDESVSSRLSAMKREFSKNTYIAE